MKCWVLKHDAYGSIEKNEIDYEGTIINGFQSHGGACVLVAKEDGNLATPEARFVKTKYPEKKELKQDGQVIDGPKQPDAGAGTLDATNIDGKTGSNVPGDGPGVGEVRQEQEADSGAKGSVRQDGSRGHSNPKDNWKDKVFRRGNR